MIKKGLTPNQIDLDESDYLYVGKSKLPNAGYGLFTAIVIYKDEIIALYKGEVLSQKETTKRASDNNNQFFIELLNGKILDCKNVAGFAKFANDAKGNPSGHLSNNAKIALTSKQEVCLIAKRKINIGEEIYCSYGKRYWNKA
ncbi:MAG: SET domain-containing protein [Flavobacterium sp.]|nr:MAG: SET domain-containing protein [Flavobacterium sp.]